MTESSLKQNNPAKSADIVVLGAGAAGMMAAIQAARSFQDKKILLIDGAGKIGTKILISGGGRCNVTNEKITPEDYCGTSRNSIKKILSRFTKPQTEQFFKEIGVVLKTEETGKLFPVSNKANSVLQALLLELRTSGVELQHPFRVHSITKRNDHFLLSGPRGEISCLRLILATGGKSFPKTGSDGHGHKMAQSLGHSINPLFPALVPVELDSEHYTSSLGGITLPTRLEVRSETGKCLASFTGSTLCTHFGLSGPCTLNISRFYLNALATDCHTTLNINWLPEMSEQEVDVKLQNLRDMTVLNFLRSHLPNRLAEAICSHVNISAEINGNNLSKQFRKSLTKELFGAKLPVKGTKGYAMAEVTAGGIPLHEIQLKTMESRVCPGLYLCGEICDVDGRIGGFNFQWAWSSGYVAGVSAGC